MAAAGSLAYAMTEALTISRVDGEVVWLDARTGALRGRAEVPGLTALS